MLDIEIIMGKKNPVKHKRTKKVDPTRVMLAVLVGIVEREKMNSKITVTSVPSG